MNTTQTPFTAVAEQLGDAFTEALHDSTELARVSARLYRESWHAAVEQQRLAREWMPELAGVPSELGRDLARSSAPAARDGAEAAAGTAATAEKVGRAATETARRARPPVVKSTPTWNSEAYDSLSAAEVVEKLPGYSQRELSTVELHEQAHEARQTVLQRIESLRGTEPLTGYDELTVPEVDAKLTAGDVALAKSVRDYERQHKKREGVLNAARTLIEKG